MDMILILYVGDLLLLVQDLSKIEDIKRRLGQLYQMKDLGPASSYLGIRITRDRKRRVIWIDQQAYIENTLKRFELQDTNSTKTPLKGCRRVSRWVNECIVCGKSVYLGVGIPIYLW